MNPSCDFDKWESDPEEWVISEQGARADFDFTAATQGCFKTLCTSHPRVLAPFILGLLQQTASIPPLTQAISLSQLENNPALDALLRKEATYMAAGLGVNELFDELKLGMESPPPNKPLVSGYS